MLHGLLPSTEKNESVSLTSLTAVEIMCQIVHDNHPTVQDNANFDDVVIPDSALLKSIDSDDSIEEAKQDPEAPNTSSLRDANTSLLANDDAKTDNNASYSLNAPHNRRACSDLKNGYSEIHASRDVVQPKS